MNQRQGDVPEEAAGEWRSAWEQELDQIDDRAASDILRNLAAVYVPTHDYRKVMAQDFRHLDLSYYENTTRFLRGEGFSEMADVQDRTLESAPGNVLFPAFIRAMVSAEGTITAGIYHARVKPLWLRALLFLMGKSRMKVVDFETEFSDGSFVCTSNAMAAASIRLPPSVDVLYLPARSSPEQVLRAHRSRLEDHARTHPSSRKLVVGSFEAMVASQNRMNALKAAFRGELGGISKEELERLSLLGKGAARRVHEKIQSRRRER